MLSERIRRMEPSMTVELTDRLTELKRKGIDVISLNIGEPDFDTPKNIINAAKAAMDKGFTRYTVVSGILELKNGICEKFKRDNGIEYTVDEVIVSSGAKQALTNALLTLCDKGDEVIIFTPCWVSYIEMVKLADAVPVLVNTNEEKEFRIDFDNLKKSITSKTKAIMVNTPNNPTGAVYTKEDLEKLAELSIEHDFYIISDEIYEKLIYDGAEHISIASISEEVKKRTITINGMSKTYCMTGWRIGYAAGPKKIIKGMNDLQGHMTSGPNSIAQKAAYEALTGSQDSVKNMLLKYDERRRYLLNRLTKIEGIKCRDVKGAFYLFPDISSFFGKSYDGRIIKNSIDFSQFLLETANVAVVPGIAFEAPNNIRIAYCNSLENIKNAIDRIEVALSKLKD